MCGSYSIYRDACLLGQSLCQSLNTSVFSAVVSRATTSQLTRLGTHSTSPSSKAGWSILGLEHDVSRWVSQGERSLSECLVLGFLGEMCWAGHCGGEHIWTSSWISVTWPSMALWFVSAAGWTLAFKLFKYLKSWAHLWLYIVALMTLWMFLPLT